MEITLAEYARRHHKDPSTVRQKAISGGFNTARKLNARTWVIDENEPYIDNRFTQKSILTKEAFETLPDEHRSRIVKMEQAKQYSGWRSYPSTCQAIFDNIPTEWFDRYTAKQLGEIAALLKKVYDKGRYDEQQQKSR
jgi:hypothetical protein